MTGGFKVKLKFGTLVSTNKESSSCVDNVKPVQSDGIAIGLCKNTFAIHSAALKRGVGGTRTAGTGRPQ